MIKPAKKVEKYELSEEEEKYILLYHEYFVMKHTWNEICKKYNCTKQMLQSALHWVVENKINIPSANLIKGAIDALENRIKINRELYDKEVAKQRYQDKGFIVALTKELREDEKMVFKLQEIYKDPEENQNNLSPAQVLSLIKANQNV